MITTHVLSLSLSLSPSSVTIPCKEMSTTVIDSEPNVQKQHLHRRAMKKMRSHLHTRLVKCAYSSRKGHDHLKRSTRGRNVLLTHNHRITASPSMMIASLFYALFASLKKCWSSMETISSVIVSLA